MYKKICETARFAIYYDGLFGVMKVENKGYAPPYTVLVSGDEMNDFIENLKQVQENGTPEETDRLCHEHYGLI